MHDKKLYSTASTNEKNRDRYERRKCYLLKDISWLQQEWDGLKSVFAIKREVNKTNGEKSQEIGYYISSLEAKPERFLEIVRRHWGIESMHWLLDVDFGEDGCRLVSKNAQKSLNVFRKLSLCLHKHHIEQTKGKKNIFASMFSCLLDDSNLIKLLNSCNIL